MRTEQIETNRSCAGPSPSHIPVAAQADTQPVDKTTIHQGKRPHLRRPDAEREQVERALIKALQQWETTFDAASDSMMLVDCEYKVIQANTATAKVLDKPLGQILGKSCHELLGGKDAPPQDWPLSKAKQTGKHQQGELYINSRDAWITVSADPIFDEQGNVIRFVHIIRDITENKKSEHALQKLNKELDQTVSELKRSNEELRSFAHVVAHDLKSPLRGIGSLVDWFVRQYTDKFDEQGKKRVNLLIGRVRRMAELIDNILQYSQIGHVTDKKDDVDISTLLAEIICEIDLPKNIEVSIENRLPILKCERFRIKQVFQNLLGNAIKYMDKPRGKIRIGCVEEDGCWKFSVADNGPGIKQAYFEKIFEIFQTLAPRDQVESTGVGLTVVKKIIELYGGRIWLSSQLGQGTTFFFTIPKLKSGE